MYILNLVSNHFPIILRSLLSLKNITDKMLYFHFLLVLFNFYIIYIYFSFVMIGEIKDKKTIYIVH